MTLERIDVAKMSKLVNMLPEDWCEAQLEADQKEHRAVIREILPYVDHREDCLIFRDNYHEALWKASEGEGVERECNCGVEPLRQKYGGK